MLTGKKRICKYQLLQENKRRSTLDNQRNAKLKNMILFVTYQIVGFSFSWQCQTMLKNQGKYSQHWHSEGNTALNETQGNMGLPKE